MPRLEIAFDLLVGPRRDMPMTWPHLHIGRSGAADLRLVPVGRRVHHGSELTIAPGHRKQQAQASCLSYLMYGEKAESLFSPQDTKGL